VISGNRNLYKLFKIINEKVFHDTLHIICFERYQGLMIAGTNNKVKKAFYILLNIIRERRYLKETYNKYFVEVRRARVFFFSKWWGNYAFYLLKKLGKTNELVYIPDPSYDVLPIEHLPPTNIVDLVILAITKLTFGHNMTVDKVLGHSVACIPNDFMEKEVHKVIDVKERNEMMRNFDLSQFRIFGMCKYSVVYFDQDLVEAGYIADEDTFNRELTSIFNILGKYFSQKEIACKYHPRHSSNKTKIRIGDVLPDYVPAEFLYDDNTKLYLSVFSFAIANVEKGLAVSIADLITFENADVKHQLKEILIQRSKSTILSPKSLDEFERIVAGVSRA